MAEFRIEGWLPQEINQGPPLPEFLNIYWPWYTPPAEEVLEFELVKPVVTPEEIYPGTKIALTCPVTSSCSNPQTATVKIIIYEGSILPGHGTKITTKTSAPFSISPGESYNVIFHHTAIAGTIDRRDVEIEVYVSVKLVKQSEWDDVYYVAPAPAADIILEDLTIYPPEVPVGGMVAISVRVTNYGDVTGTKTIVCTVS